MNIIRYPKTNDHSLRAWSAADEYLLQLANKSDLKDKNILTYNDRFGYLNCQLKHFHPITVISYKSQLKAHKINLESNNLDFDADKFITPLSSIEEEIDVVFMKIPKSLDLFRLYMVQIASCLKNDGIVYCSFMTRHFTKQLISIADEYFEEVEQSLALKKARVLTLKGKKQHSEKSIINELKLNEKELIKQYFGVFSAKEIDFATQFFIQNLKLDSKYEKVIDLASGNGVLAYQIKKELPDSEIHLVDDSFLAIVSSKLNIELSDDYFHYNDCLDDFADNSFDLVVSNPPFHFEYETNIEISLGLFKDAHRCLKAGGSFQLVSNRHLNYGTHLKKLFNFVEIAAQNDRFETYNCVK